METATAVMGRFRTPEEQYRAYLQYRQDIQPVIDLMVRIRSMATPHWHIRQLHDGAWEVVSDPNEGLPPESRDTLALLEAHVRDMAAAYGLATLDGA